MKSLALLALCLPLYLVLLSTPASAYHAPERLVYDLSWTGVRLGTAVYEVVEKEGAVTLVFTVRTSQWLKHILAIDNRTESLLLPRGESSLYGLPRLFRENINTGKTRTVKEALFDHDRLTVQTKDLLKQTEKTDPITPRTFDSLASLYFIRSSELTPGSLTLIDMYDAKRLWNMEVRVGKREEVNTGLGRFKAVVVRSVLKSGGVVNKTGAMTVWFSDDDLRIPLRMEIKLRLGEFSAKLAGGSYWQ